MILHVDMDAFFASVEQLDNPALRGRCVLVGGMSDRGVVAACSYEARKFGIHSAMPMFRARQRCPDALVVPPRKIRYKELSVRIMEILRSFSPLVEPVSIDEAYVDITGCTALHGDPERIAKKIKTAIREQVSLTCSVGGAPLKFLAKIASDMNKPDGLTLIGPEQVMAFIETLPLNKVPGVGPKMQAQLKAIGMQTLGDVRSFGEAAAVRHLGKFGIRLRELAMGIDRSAVSTESAPKSISSEETLPINTRDRKTLGRYVLNQSQEVSGQLRRKSLRAKTVTLKLKRDNFTLITRQAPLSRPTQAAEPIYRKAMELLEAHTLTREIRLIGVGVSGLLPVDTPVQMELFGAAGKQENGWERVDRAVDRIAERFGKGIIHRASQGGVRKAAETEPE